MAEPARPTVSVVILAWGAEPILEEAVAAALASEQIEVDVVLVDNGCTTDAVERSARLERVTVVRPGHNTGFAGGCNLGARHARGEYLANSVAMCVQCHSGRDERGEIIEAEKFRGAAIPAASALPAKKFAYRAPAIAGLPGMTDEEVILLLTTGRGGTRPPPQPPMPPFRMARADAEAIVAYLRTR